MGKAELESAMRKTPGAYERMQRLAAGFPTTICESIAELEETIKKNPFALYIDKTIEPVRIILIANSFEDYQSTDKLSDMMYPLGIPISHENEFEYWASSEDQKILKTKPFLEHIKGRIFSFSPDRELSCNDFFSILEDLISQDMSSDPLNGQKLKILKACQDSITRSLVSERAHGEQHRGEYFQQDEFWIQLDKEFRDLMAKSIDLSDQLKLEKIKSFMLTKGKMSGATLQCMTTIELETAPDVDLTHFDHLVKLMNSKTLPVSEKKTVFPIPGEKLKTAIMHALEGSRIGSIKYSHKDLQALFKHDPPHETDAYLEHVSAEIEDPCTVQEYVVIWLTMIYGYTDISSLIIDDPEEYEMLFHIGKKLSTLDKTALVEALSQKEIRQTHDYPVEQSQSFIKLADDDAFLAQPCVLPDIAYDVLRSINQTNYAIQADRDKAIEQAVDKALSGHKGVIIHPCVIDRSGTDPFIQYPFGECKSNFFITDSVNTQKANILAALPAELKENPAFNPASVVSEPYILHRLGLFGSENAYDDCGTVPKTLRAVEFLHIPALIESYRLNGKSHLTEDIDLSLISIPVELYALCQMECCLKILTSERMAGKTLTQDQERLMEMLPDIIHAYQAEYDLPPPYTPLSDLQIPPPATDDDDRGLTAEAFEDLPLDQTYQAAQSHPQHREAITGPDSVGSDNLADETKVDTLGDTRPK